MHLYVSFRLVVSNGGLPNSMVYLEQGKGGQNLVDLTKNALRRSFFQENQENTRPWNLTLLRLCKLIFC